MDRSLPENVIGFSFEEEFQRGQYLRNGDERVFEVLDDLFASFESDSSNRTYGLMKITTRQLLLSASKIFSALGRHGIR
ncbi:hypothetical protein [Cohnella herbarum]|uniref:Uncharacterized protein n=1 Tax=Cohnella herbarum TaxID=2728023 RepID=A0A7Z2VMG6_9BACL|nr:hypothetical protein [Cohnella herbarum]QJD85727.1 hypothetical protein HH215_22755 [Cohnella herbarum]